MVRIRILALVFVPMLALAAGNGVALVTSDSGITSGSEVRRDLLEECISRLPSESEFSPVSSSKDQYLRKINGENREGYQQVWQAKIELGWQVRQRYLYVVTQKGIGKTADPIFREESATAARSETILSEPGDSPDFASSSPRIRFFATAQAAEASARKRASARLLELRSNMCKDAPLPSR